MAADAAVTLDPTTYPQFDDSALFTPPARSRDLGRNEFITLLVTQLANQNPLQPMEDKEFIAQLATFSSLEQLIDLNARMNNVIIGQEQLINSQSLELIGREVIADTGGKLRLAPHGADPIVVDFPEAQAGARVEIIDASGKVVRTIRMDDAGAGRQWVRWDGADDNGAPLPAGDYTFRIVVWDGNGVERTVQGNVSLLVDGVYVGAGGLALVSGDRTVSFAKVIEIRLPQTPTETSAPEA